MMENVMGAGMWHIWGRSDVHTELCWVNWKFRDHLEDLGIDGRIDISNLVIQISIKIV
jgi:hypothetical protein